MDAPRMNRSRAVLAWIIVLAGVGTTRADLITPAFVDRLAPTEIAAPAATIPQLSLAHLTCTRAASELTVDEPVVVADLPRSVSYLEMMAMTFVIPPVLNPVELTPFITPAQPTPKVTPTDHAHIQTFDFPAKSDSNTPPDAPEPASLILGLLGCGVGGIVAVVKRRRAL